jgi:tRNA threonylcarbamoyladenosine biosynthesis protein TsaE
MKQRIADLAGLSAAAAAFARALRPRAQEATLITLSGTLGAGKTAFVKGAAAALGVTEVVNSPTFVLEKRYPLPASAPFSRLIHIDAYRLEGGRELAPLDFGALMRDPGTLIFLEWPEKVADALPPPAAALTLMLEGGASPASGQARVISYA